MEIPAKNSSYIIVFIKRHVAKNGDVCLPSIMRKGFALWEKQIEISVWSLEKPRPFHCLPVYSNYPLNTRCYRDFYLNRVTALSHIYQWFLVRVDI